MRRASRSAQPRRQGPGGAPQPSGEEPALLLPKLPPRAGSGTGDAREDGWLMVASSCAQCGGRRWVRYFSETTDGNLEEAFRLCPCNHEPETPQGEPAHEESERRDCGRRGG